MPKLSEDSLTGYTKPPSDTEASKLANAERLVKEAIRDDKTMASVTAKAFGQGSHITEFGASIIEKRKKLRPDCGLFIERKT